MQPYILILCANLKGNIGDYAILEAMGIDLANKFADHEIRFLYHGHKGIDKHRIQPFKDELIPHLVNAGTPPFYRRPKWFRTIQKLPISKKVIQNIHSKLIQKTALKMIRNTEFSKQVSGATAVYFAGGAQWGRGDLHLNMFAQLSAAKSLGRKVYAYPFSITKQTVNGVGEENFKYLFQQLESPTPVRDLLSYKILDTLDVNALPTCDIVWSMASHITPEKRKESTLTTKVYICMTTSGGAKAQEVIQLASICKNAGFSPIVLSTCEVEDAGMIKEIEESSDIECIAPDSWKQAVQLLSEATFVITNRLHCIIFSSLADTAVIPVSNREKTKAFVRDANLPCSAEQLSEIGAEEINKFAQNSPLIIERIKSFKEQCQIDIAKLYKD